MSRRIAYAGVLACALVTAASGITRLPIDDHEAFVVQTAQEMRERGDWIVPYFNGRPRLKKPPLSYWATAALAEATGAPHAREWHGRLPSVAGAIGLVALTMVMAELLYDRRTALAAGLVAATSVGVFRYAHSARPDMLYAFWCTALVVAFLWSTRRGSRPGRAPALTAWVCVGLATLTKGPQLPAMLLVAFVLDGWRSGTSISHLVRTIRPVEGLLVAAAIALPWWWAVDRALPGGLGGTQLGGSLLAPSWRHVLDPYFLYRPLALLAPSIVIVAPALWHRRLPRWDDTTRLLVLLVVVPAVLLAFGPQRRPHYMLPALAPLAVLTARTIVGLLDAGVASWATRALPVLWVSTVLLDATFGASSVLWSHERFVTASVAQQAGVVCAPTEPIVAMDVGAPAASYYAGRRIRRLRSPRPLLGLVDAAPHGVLCLIAPAKRLAQLPTALSATPVHPGSQNDALPVLVRVSRAPTP